MAFELVRIEPEIDIAGFHSLYYFEFDKNFYHPPEKHDFWEMVYVDEGRIHAIADGIGCTLSKGQVIFHKPMEMHSHIANHQDASNLVVVSFSSPSPRMAYFNKKIFSLEKHSRKIISLFLEEAKNALCSLPGEYENKSPVDFSRARPGSVQLMQCYLVEFLFSLIRSDETSVSAMQPTKAARRMAAGTLVSSIESYIESELAASPSLELLCQHFSLSRAYLCRIFKEETGTSPIDYWIGLKMKEAKKLLRESNYNVTQISELLGYASIHHFSRMFKRAYGVSPTAYQSSIGG